MCYEGEMNRTLPGISTDELDQGLRRMGDVIRRQRFVFLGVVLDGGAKTFCYMDTDEKFGVLSRLLGWFVAPRTAV